MWVYIFLLSFLAIGALFVYQSRSQTLQEGHLRYALVGGIFIFLIMALRDVTVGTDLIGYLREFEHADDYLYYEFRKTELGYSYLNYFFSSLGFSFQFYLGFLALISTSAITYFYYKYSRNVFLSFFLHVTIGLFAMSMTGLRQTIAISITIISLMLMIDNKRIISILLIGLAYIFHNSSISFLPVILIRKIQLKRSYAFFLFISFILLFFTRGLFTPSLEHVVPTGYMRYLPLSDEIKVNPLVIIVAIAIPLATLLLWPKDNVTRNKKYSTIMSIFFILSCVNFVTYFLALEVKLFERVGLYFAFYNTILVPNIIQDIKNRNVMILARVSAVILPLLQFIIATRGGSMGIDNYKFYWE